MSSAKYCCVPGCIQSGEINQPLHRFPNPELERERFNTWLYAIGGDIIGLQNDFIFTYRRVCRRHFEMKFLCRNNRLSNTAIPTLNMPDLKSPQRFSFGTRKPMREIQNTDLKLSKSTEISPESLLDVSGYTAGQLAPQMISMMPSTSSSVMNEENQGIIGEIIDLQGVNSPLQKAKSEHHSITTDAVTSHNSTPGERAPGLTIRKNKKHLFLTAAEINLRKKLISAKIKLSKYKSKLVKQSAEIKAAKKLATSPAIVKTIENCSSIAKLLMQIQWRENKKKVEGRRFTLNEKIAALSIMKQSTKAYRFLRKIFVLPAPQTLIKLIQKSNIQPGINKNIFAQLEKKAKTLTRTQKLCILLHDEISIKASLSYCKRKGRISGFVDNGENRQSDFANHALVFMIRGLVQNYKQPVAFSFANSATKGPELAKQIKTVVTKVQEAGFIVVASICDQGTNNRQAIKLLLNETRGIYLRRAEDPKDNIIIINNKEIVPLYDPPHLLKGIRNNLLHKDLKYVQNGVVKVAKWSHLQLLYSENPAFEGIRLIPKLTENHVNPQKMNKMKVKLASQVFSRTVASNMGYLSDKGILPTECRDTASLLHFMDNLFDSFNGSYKKNSYAKPLLAPATPKSLHNNTWSEAIKVFKTMSFITATGKEECVPSINNWVWTLKSVQILLRKINEQFSINSIWMRHLNQDPLENFFGAIRSHGCRNNNPTCEQFQSIFTALLINNLYSVHTQGKNCEEDFCDALHALVIDDNYEPMSTSSVDFTNILYNINCPSIDDKKSDPRKIAPLQYVSGYFLKKSKENIFKNCQMCNADLINKDCIEYINYREYAGRRWLYSPTEQFIQLISDFQNIINGILKTKLECPLLKDAIFTAIFTFIDFKFINCLLHKQRIIDYLMVLVSDFYIYLYCKNINKILCGRIGIFDDEDVYQNKAKKMYSKCIKRMHT